MLITVVIVKDIVGLPLGLSSSEDVLCLWLFGEDVNARHFYSASIVFDYKAYYFKNIESIMNNTLDDLNCQAMCS